MQQDVRLYNRGRDIYNEIDLVVVLDEIHRLSKHEAKAGEPLSPEQVSYNERADRFLEILHRVRVLTLTTEDYYWLCGLKRSRKSLPERNAFKDAPVLMEFRRETAAHPEDNCEYYNRMLLRSLARQHKQPVVGIAAYHEGISHAEGQKLDDERFSGLAKHIELADEARVLITHNLHVEFGLMNGAQGVVKGILFAPIAHPLHHDLPCACLAAFWLTAPSTKAKPSSQNPNVERGCPSFLKPFATRKRRT